MVPAILFGLGLALVLVAMLLAINYLLIHREAKSRCHHCGRRFGNGEIRAIVVYWDGKSDPVDVDVCAACNARIEHGDCRCSLCAHEEAKP